MCCFAFTCLAQGTPRIDSISNNNAPYATINWERGSFGSYQIHVFRGTAIDSMYLTDSCQYYETVKIDSSVIPGIKYYYKLQAYTSGSHSGFSNIDSFQINNVWVASKISAIWDKRVNKVKITYVDKSTEELKVNIYRSSKEEMDKIIYTNEHSSPNGIGKSIIVDSLINTNKWYQYKAVIYNDNGYLSSNTFDVFTLDFSQLIAQPPKNLAGETQWFIGSKPIQYGGSCLKFGDTIVVIESNAPKNAYSLYNVSNPYDIKFLGYKTDSLLPLTINENGDDPCLTQMDKNLCLYRGINLVNDLTFYTFRNGKFEKVNGANYPHTVSANWICTSNSFQVLQANLSLKSIIIKNISSCGSLSVQDYALKVSGDSIKMNSLGSSRYNYHEYKIYKHYCFDKMRYWPDPITPSYKYFLTDLNLNKSIELDSYIPDFDSIPFSQMDDVVEGYLVGNWFTSNFHHIYIDTVKQVAFLISNSSIRAEKIKPYSTSILKTIKHTSVGPQEMIIRKYDLMGRIITKVENIPQLQIQNNSKYGYQKMLSIKKGKALINK
jgi:hypothetical protein